LFQVSVNIHFILFCRVSHNRLHSAPVEYYQGHLALITSSVSSEICVVLSHFLWQTVFVETHHLSCFLCTNLFFSAAYSFLHHPSFHPLLPPIHTSLSFCLLMAVRRTTVGNKYNTIWQNQIFFLFFSKFNLVLNIPLALIRCPRWQIAIYIFIVFRVN